MSFKEIDLEIETSYYSAKCNLVDSFYNKVLSKSCRYDRVSGFFSSTSLAVAAVGMTNFILNKGRMRLVCSAQLNKNDIEAIDTAEDLKMIISNNFAEDFDAIENELIKNHVKMLGWMIANDFLEIKIGVTLDENGDFDIGIVHPKIGILYDELNNSIVFDGSVNESESGWLRNVESLRVFKSWKHFEFMENDASNFDDLWFNTTEGVEIFDIPDIPKSILIENAPKSESEFKKLADKTNKELKKLLSKSKPKLRKYQIDALKSWMDNGYKGIFSMATGTGKTFTAISCFERLLHENNKLLTVVACPQLHLINQWESAIREFGYNGKCIKASSDNNKWKKELMKTIADLMGSKKNAVVLTSFDTFSDEKFINIINLYSDKSFVIVDEIHGIGSYKYRQGFLDVNYDYRLGLSATPEIEDDLERTDLVYDYFGGIVFEYSLKKAIDEGFLTPYDYHPIFVDLTEKELNKYKDLSRKIATLLNKKNLKHSEEEKLDKYIRQRRNLINKAENKLKCLREFLDMHKDIKDLIVYCADTKHLTEIETILDNYDIKNHPFTGQENPTSRETILKLFSNGHYRALCAMKCLDEGVDVPSTQNALLLASTMNSRQHIQRRGRILRKYPGKESANIYDFIIVPNIKDESESVKNILKSEKKRYDEYVNSAKNRLDCKIKIANKWEEIL